MINATFFDLLAVLRPFNYTGERFANGLPVRAAQAGLGASRRQKEVLRRFYKGRARQ